MEYSFLEYGTHTEGRYWPVAITQFFQCVPMNKLLCVLEHGCTSGTVSDQRCFWKQLGIEDEAGPDIFVQIIWMSFL